MGETNADREYDPYWITGEDLERYFSLEDALLEFSRLFKHDETNDRALVIVGLAKPRESSIQNRPSSSLDK